MLSPFSLLDSMTYVVYIPENNLFKQQHALPITEQSEDEKQKVRERERELRTISLMGA